MNMDGRTKAKNPVWTWIGCTCGVLVALGLALVVSVTWFGYRAGKNFEANLKDPVARAERSRQVLGYDTLPEGYHPAGAFELPFVVEMAMLTDREIPAGEAVDEERAFENKGFVFVKARGMSDRDRRRLDDYLEGRSETSDVFGVDNSAIHFQQGKVIARGSVPVVGGTARFVAQEGRRSSGRESLITVAFVECANPPDSRARMAMWFEALAEAPDPANPYAGTPADENRLREFLGHFQLCK